MRTTKKFFTAMVLGCVLVFAAGALYWWGYVHRISRAIPAHYDLKSVAYPDIRLPDKTHYLQNDPRWAGERLGGTDESLGQVGCTIASVAAALTNLGIAITPLELNTQLQNAGGYTSRGWLIWSAIEKVTVSKANVVAYRSPSHDNINACLNERNYPVVKFLINGVVPHWVLVVGREQGDYLVRDPLVTKTDAIKLSSRTSLILSHRCVRKNRSNAEMSGGF